MLKQLIKRFIEQKGFILYRVRKEEVAQGIATDVDLRKYLLREALVLAAGEINASEAHFLGELVSEADPEGVIVEIGSLFGCSTSVIVNHKRKDQPLLSVDNYSWNPLGFTPDEHFEVLRERLAEAIEHHHVKLVRQEKNDFFTKSEIHRPALVFLDADHSYEETRRDIDWAKSVGAGIICGHDYEQERFPGVVQAVDEFGGPKKLVDSLWVID